MQKKVLRIITFSKLFAYSELFFKTVQLSIIKFDDMAVIFLLSLPFYLLIFVAPYVIPDNTAHIVEAMAVFHSQNLLSSYDHQSWSWNI